MLLFMAACSHASSQGQWQPHKLAVQDVVIEITIPFANLDDLYKPDWGTPFRAPSLELLLSGRESQLRFFKAPLDIKGPYRLSGVYGVVTVTGYVNRKPDWFQGDLFDIEALGVMKDRHLREFGGTDRYRVEIVKINAVPWVHWFDYDLADPKSKTTTPRHDRYTRPLTKFLYLDVMFDTSKAAVSEDLNWLKEAETMHEQVRNSLVIRYPATVSKIQRSPALNR